jgi:hypothetical protein
MPLCTCGARRRGKADLCVCDDGMGLHVLAVTPMKTPSTHMCAQVGYPASSEARRASTVAYEASMEALVRKHGVGMPVIGGKGREGMVGDTATKQRKHEQSMTVGERVQREQTQLPQLSMSASETRVPKQPGRTRPDPNPTQPYSAQPHTRSHCLPEPQPQRFARTELRLQPSPVQQTRKLGFPSVGEQYHGSIAENHTSRSGALDLNEKIDRLLRTMQDVQLVNKDIYTAAALNQAHQVGLEILTGVVPWTPTDYALTASSLVRLSKRTKALQRARICL